MSVWHPEPRVSALFLGSSMVTFRTVSLGGDGSLQPPGRPPLRVGGGGTVHRDEDPSIVPNSTEKTLPFHRGEKTGSNPVQEGDDRPPRDGIDPSETGIFAVFGRSFKGEGTVFRRSFGFEGIPRGSLSHNVRDRSEARRHGRTCGRLVRVPRGRGRRRNRRSASHGRTGPGSARGTGKRRGEKRRTHGCRDVREPSKRAPTLASLRVRGFARKRKRRFEPRNNGPVLGTGRPDGTAADRCRLGREPRRM